MNTRHNDLPLNGNITLTYIFSFLVAILMTVASIAGILFRADIYPTEELMKSFVPNDVVNLFLGLPILLGSMWLTWRGRLIGLLCWSGALFFVFYNYIVYVFAMPLNWAFPLHLILTVLSLYTLIGLVTDMDGNAVRQRLSGAVPEKFTGGILAGLGSLFLLRVIGVFVNAITSGTLLAETELAVNVSDLLITPAWIIGGILLWQRKPLGYLAGLGLLFQGSMLFIALIVFLLLQPLLTSAPFAAADVIVIFMLGLVCFIPSALFVRGVLAKSKASSEQEN
jgi:hypothetical protein